MGRSSIEPAWGRKFRLGHLLSWERWRLADAIQEGKNGNPIIVSLELSGKCARADEFLKIRKQDSHTVKYQEKSASIGWNACDVAAQPSSVLARQRRPYSGSGNRLKRRRDRRRHCDRHRRAKR